ncbi:MAG: hypothetical protein ACI4M6_07105 [Christensenellaceae bacterium]
MYRFQLKFQKIICIAAFIACIVSLLYALGFCSDLYKVLYPGVLDQDHPELDYFKGANLYYQAQPLNNFLVMGSIVILVTSLLLFITQTNSRRKYYISNYVATGVNFVALVGFSIASIAKITAFKFRYVNEVDWKTLQELAKALPGVYVYDTSTAIFDLGAVLYVAIILIAIVLLANMILKIILMNGEKKLLNQSKENSIDG